VASLLSGDILSDIRIVETGFLARFLDTAQGDDAAARKAYAAFLSTVTLHQWSADSTQLLIAAMRDGSSSDVFAVDVLNNAVRRVTNTPGQLSSMHMSPDQRWIVTGDRDSIAEDAPVRFQALRTDGAQRRDLSGDWRSFVGWFGPSIGALAKSTDGRALRQLTAFDLERGTIMRLWDDAFNDAVADASSSQLTFCGASASGTSEYTVLVNSLEPTAGGACVP
jgi:hypothetical protein